MADVIRFSFHSLRFSSSSSLLTSFSSSSTSLQPGLPPIPNSDKRVYPLLHSSSSARDFARFAFTPRKQLVSLKVSACPFIYFYFLFLCMYLCSFNNYYGVFVKIDWIYEDPFAEIVGFLWYCVAIASNCWKILCFIYLFILCTLKWKWEKAHLLNLPDDDILCCN